MKLKKRGGTIYQSSIPGRSLETKKPEDLNSLLLYLTALDIYSAEQQKQFSVITSHCANHEMPCKIAGNAKIGF